MTWDDYTFTEISISTVVAPFNINVNINCIVIVYYCFLFWCWMNIKVEVELNDMQLNCRPINTPVPQKKTVPCFLSLSSLFYL